MDLKLYTRVVVETVALPDGSTDANYLLAAPNDVDEEFLVTFYGETVANRCTIENWSGMVVRCHAEDVTRTADEIGVEAVLAFPGPGPYWPSATVYTRDPDHLAALKMVLWQPPDRR